LKAPCEWLLELPAVWVSPLTARRPGKINS
jgi:hypothetical protein